MPSIAAIAARVDAARLDRLARARRLQRQAQRLARSQGAAQPAPSPDPVLRFPGIREGTTLREVFDRFRALGREPHALGFRGDDAILAAMARQDAASDTSAPWAGEFEPIDPGTDYPWAGQIESQNPAAVAPHPRLGINKGIYPVDGYEGPDVEPCDGTNADACKVGWFQQILRDVAAAGGSVVRQVGDCDLVWNWMFESGDTTREIPEPAVLYRLLTVEAPTSFHRFNMLMWACLRHGVRVQPTVFTLGGGSNLNDGHADGDAFPTVDGALLTYGDVRSVARTAGVIMPAAGGWASWYWDPSEIGVEADGDVHTDVPYKHAFERYCLHVLSHDTDITDPYMLEAARRKSLALIAFGAGVGEHLALWDKVLAGFGLCITDIVPYVEIGNEMSVQWRTGEPGDDDFSRSARELATFHVCLAGPMHAACTKLRFSLAGIGAWGAPEPTVWQQRVDWFAEALAVGVLVELGHLVTVRQLRDLPIDDPGLEDAWPEQVAWLETCEASGLCIWPPPLLDGGLDPASWFHHVNMHWFHSSDHQGTAPVDGYATEARLVQDVGYLKDRLLVNLVGNRVLTLSWALHPGGFPAAQPTRPETADKGWSSFASPLFQAGMVVRILLTALSQGAEIASWHTHIAIVANPGGEGWSIYSAMGLRQDLIEGPVDHFRAAEDAWRRPSWCSFRRLAALLSGDSTVSLLRCDADGFVLVRLERPGGFTEAAPELGLTSGVATHRYAYIAWLDQTAAIDSADFVLYGSIDDGGSTPVARLSLAPAVETPDAPGGTDANGYVTGATVRWAWGEDDALPGTGSGDDWRSVADIAGDITATDGDLRFKVTIHRANDPTAPVPACLLSDLDLSP